MSVERGRIEVRFDGAEEPKAALFRTVDPTGRLTGRALDRRLVLAMIAPARLESRC